MTLRMLGLAIKRIIDVLVSALGLLAISPILALLGLLVYAAHGWPIFFVQDRPGLHGRIFRMVKFRTMTNARNANGQLLPDKDRLTRLGQFLRSTSMDELPELWNVLKGDMSLVGPRPLLVRYLQRYTPEQARRHTMRPGITGLAQVRGRNALTWPQKFALDLQYIDGWRLGLDLQILWETVAVVLAGSDVSADGAATMPEFMGADGLGVTP